VTGQAAALNAATVASAQTVIMTKLGLPTAVPVLTTDPVAFMLKAGATVEDARLERTNAATQVSLQQVAQSITASAD